MIPYFDLPHHFGNYKQPIKMTFCSYQVVEDHPRNSFLRKLSLILTNYNWDLSEDYYAMSYIISNPHLWTIWSSKCFGIHPHTAQKIPTLLVYRTFGHPVCVQK